MPTKKKAIGKVSPKAKQVQTYSFGDAIKIMSTGGQKMARQGWNGKSMFVMWVPPTKNAILVPDTPYAKAFPRRKKVDIEGHFDMFTADRKMQPGWLASQQDMVATDWVIVK